MTFTRTHWLRSLLAGLAVLMSPAGASNLLAQGPDPFRPYNRQYDPYTLPMGPADAAPGQFVGGMPRSGIRGANQYQNYLEDLQGGGGRQAGDRGGVGVPYYRSSVDSSFDPNGNREYRPNQKGDRVYEQSQELVTRKYLAYFSEKDPRKRAALLKEYNQARSKVSRALSTRRDNQARVLEDATGAATETRRPAASGSAPPRLPSATDRAPRGTAADSGRGSSSRDIPAAPPLFGTGAGRSTRGTRTPEDVLNRSRRLAPSTEGQPGRSAPTGSRPSASARPPALSPE